MVRSWCSKGWQYWLLVLGCSLKLTHRFLLWHHWHSELKWAGGGVMLITPRGNSRGMPVTWWPTATSNLHSLLCNLFYVHLYTRVPSMRHLPTKHFFLGRRKNGSSIKHLKTAWCQNSSKLLWWCALNVLIWVQPFPRALPHLLRQFGSLLSCIFGALRPETGCGGVFVKSSHLWDFVCNNESEHVIWVIQVKMLPYWIPLVFMYAFWRELLFSGRGTEVWCVSNSRLMLCVPVRVCGFRKAPYMDLFGDKSVIPAEDKPPNGICLNQATQKLPEPFGKTDFISPRLAIINYQYLLTTWNLLKVHGFSLQTEYVVYNCFHPCRNTWNAQTIIVLYLQREQRVLYFSL